MSVQLFPGVTVSGRHVVENFDLFMESSADPVELIVQKAATKISRSGKTHPFVYDEKAYFTALEHVRWGEPVDVVVAALSRMGEIKRHMRISGDSGVANPDYGVSMGHTPEFAWPHSGQNGYEKPSKDLKRRFDVNRRLRIPEEKRRSHYSPNEPLPVSRDIEYGARFTFVSASRAREFFTSGGEYSKVIGAGLSEGAVSSAHQRALAKLFSALRTPHEPEDIPTEKRNRHGKLIEAYEDLERFPSPVLPERSTHINLMSVLSAAVMGNMRLDVQLIPPAYHNGSANLGYLVRQI